MAGHRRSENGVALLTYVPAKYGFSFWRISKTWMAGINPAMTRQDRWHPVERSFF
ncbi:MAG: hypothetical protein WBB98_23245 [Xanthobacteraceae bacterium]